MTMTMTMTMTTPWRLSIGAPRGFDLHAVTRDAVTQRADSGTWYDFGTFTLWHFS
jgi:hypothetical protein